MVKPERTIGRWYREDSLQASTLDSNWTPNRTFGRVWSL